MPERVKTDGEFKPMPWRGLSVAAGIPAGNRLRPCAAGGDVPTVCLPTGAVYTRRYKLEARNPYIHAYILDILEHLP